MQHGYACCISYRLSMEGMIVKVKFYINAESQAIIADSSCIEVLQDVDKDAAPLTKLPFVTDDIELAKTLVGDTVRISGKTIGKTAMGNEYSTRLYNDGKSLTVIVGFAKSFDDYQCGECTLTGIMVGKGNSGELLVERAEDWVLEGSLVGTRTEDPVGSVTFAEAQKLPADSEVSICGWCQNLVSEKSNLLIKDNDSKYVVVELLQMPWPYICKGDRVVVTGRLAKSTNDLWNLVAANKEAIKFLYIQPSEKKAIISKATTTSKTTTSTTKTYTYSKCHTGNVLVFQHASGAGLYLGGWTRDAWPKAGWAVIDLTGNKDLKAGEISADNMVAANAFSSVLATTASDNIVLRLPIKDMNIPSWERAVWLALVEDTKKLLAAGVNILICCTGGHGRTGLAAAILMGLLTDNEEIKTDPITWLRKNYCEEIVETIPQAQYVWKMLELEGKPPEAATKYYLQGNYQGNWQQGNLVNTSPKAGTQPNTMVMTNGKGLGKKTKVLCDACHEEIATVSNNNMIEGFIICSRCMDCPPGQCCICDTDKDTMLAAPGWIKNFNTFMDKTPMYYCEKHLPMPAYSICTDCGCAIKLKKWLVDPVCIKCWEKTK